MAGMHQQQQHPGQMPSPEIAPPLFHASQLKPFLEPLPIPPIARSSGKRPVKGSSVHLPYYRVAVREFRSQVHPEIPPTRFWGFGNSVPGPTIETRSGEGLVVEWPNELPNKHFLPIDHRLMGAEPGKPEARTVVHLHGAKTPPVSDGYPENWYTPGKSAMYHYPNEQQAAMLWYHDHSMGINRLNMYAGMMGLFIVRDQVEEDLHLPSGDYEIPLVLFDRMFKTDGQLYYPVSQWPQAPWLPEVYGDAVLLNGKLLPYLEVEPRKYRFRILNSSNGRIYRLSLANGQNIYQIGTDGGLLSAPVELKVVQIAPAERADVVIDFSDHKGEQIIFQNNAAQLMQIRVKREGKPDDSDLPKTLRPIKRLLESAAVKNRELSLDEIDNDIAEPMIHLLNGSRWSDPITEKPVLGTTEIWSFVNATGDVHPIHLHLVQFQILDRQPIQEEPYLYHKRIHFLDRRFPPDPEEMGWKDTVRCTPGALTRIIVPFEGYPGRYVWHCHILEHEDNEMMRPYEILPAAKSSGAGE